MWKEDMSEVEFVSNIDSNDIIQCADKIGVNDLKGVECTLDAIVNLEILRDVDGLRPMEIMFLVRF